LGTAWKDSLTVFLKGALMGFADLIPGVSGGTMAFITGIYDRLIDALYSLTELARPSKKRFWALVKEQDYAFLAPLAAGIAFSLLLLSRAVFYIVTEQAALSYAFFSGLILGSAALLFGKVGRHTFVKAGFIAAGLAVGVLLASVSGVEASSSLPFFFASAAVAITAMLLPGISGSHVLVMLGQYSHALKVLKEFRVVEGAVFLLGALTGLALFSRIIHYFLHKHREASLSFLTGLMIGSLKATVLTAFKGGTLAWPLASAFAGFSLVFLLEKGGAS